mgnify:CR=1 FL=1
MPKGGAEPQKKDTTKVVSFFWEYISTSFQVHAQNQIEAQRSGSDLEKRSKGAEQMAVFIKKSPEQSGIWMMGPWRCFVFQK